MGNARREVPPPALAEAVAFEIESGEAHLAHRLAQLVDLRLAVGGIFIDRGNSVLVIEHNIQLIEQSDWVIDLGPDGGDLGGEIVAVGTPEEIAANPRSITGRYLSRTRAEAAVTA